MLQTIFNRRCMPVVYAQEMSDYTKRLTKLMEGKEWDRTRLSKEMGISYQAVKKVLDGKSRFGTINNQKVARLFGVGTDWYASEDVAQLYPPQDRAPVERVSERRTSYHSIPSVEDACNALARYLEGLPESDKESAAGWLAGLARRPSSSPFVIGALMDMLANAKQEHPEQGAGN